jgi:hypothetical protein
MADMTPHDPSYPTCNLTFGSLCVLSEEMHPQEVTSLLGINPTKSLVAGESRASGTHRIVNKLSGWFLSSEGVLSSRDSRDHLDWLLTKLNGKDDAIAEFHRRGWQAFFFFYWSSSSGHGGPTLSPPQTKRLAELNLRFHSTAISSTTKKSANRALVDNPPSAPSLNDSHNDNL